MKKNLLIGDGSLFVYINWISISFLKTKKEVTIVWIALLLFSLFCIYICLCVRMNEDNTKEKKRKRGETDQHVNVDP